MKNDTICALSTPAGAGGVAVIRVSGDNSRFFAEKMFAPAGRTAVKDFEPYRMYTGEFDAGDFKDFGMLVLFHAPKSYTGEDMAEFHVHGGVAVVRGMLKRLADLGCRSAERGEFTRRAFLNGKLSLSSAEGLIDIINSESEGEIRAGYSLYREKLKGKIDALQAELKAVLAEIGAALDYPDEVGEEGVKERAAAAFSRVRAAVTALKDSYFIGSRLAGGVKVGIVGKPNVGKSSLLNALLRCDKAIVSEYAGTTRDVVEGSAVYNGVKFGFKDTAGIRETENAVERVGVERSKKVLEEADILVVVLDGSEPLAKEDREILSLTAGRNCIVAANKSDLGGAAEAAEISISAKSGENIDKLTEMLFNRTIGAGVDVNGEFLSEQRHYEALCRALAALDLAEAALSGPLEMVFSEAETCWRVLGEITGETASEDIVEEIFSRFCVGK